MSVGLFLLTFGLALRLTRLVVDDSITLPARNWVLNRGAGVWNRVDDTLDRTSRQAAYYRLGQLLECPWCFGVWASGAAFTTAYFWGDTKLFVFVAAAASASWLIGLATTFIYRLQSDL